MQPGLRHRPFPLNGGWGDSKDLGGFINAQAAEIAQFDDTSLLWRDSGQLVQRVIERDQIEIGFARESVADAGQFLQGKFVGITTAFGRLHGARVLDQNLAHEIGGHAEEMSPVLPIDLGLVDEPHIGFVDQRGRLQGMARPFPAQMMIGQPAQLSIDERQQVIERAAIPFAPVKQSLCDILG